ncbi:MAG: zinc ABC transporter substrate-binding protein [Calditrichaeota bacterium]|nr:zinc ABC transporter substrate-binding protein [Calditrichota bacterium]
MKTLYLLLLLISFIFANDVNIVASTSNLASIAKAIGKDHVSIDVIVKATQNPHYIEILPSYMLKISRADLYLLNGLRLDYWSYQLIDGSRNSDLAILDCSKGVEVLEVPKTKIDPSKGHIHPEGNPHYDLNPANAAIVANNIKLELMKLDPEHSEEYEQNYQSFLKDLETLPKKKDGPAIKILSYHSTWSYLAQYLNLDIVEKLEPLPGISPSPSHLNKLIGIIKANEVRFIIQEDFYDHSAAEFLSEQTGIKIMIASPYAKEVNEKSYVNHIKNLINRIGTFH